MAKSLYDMVKETHEQVNALADQIADFRELVPKTNRIKGLYAELSKLRAEVTLLRQMVMGEVDMVMGVDMASGEPESVAVEVVSVSGNFDNKHIEKVADAIFEHGRDAIINDPALDDNKGGFWNDPKVWAWDISVTNLGFYMALDRAIAKLKQDEYGRVFKDIGKKKEGLSRATVSALERGARLIPNKWFPIVRDTLYRRAEGYSLEDGQCSPLRMHVSLFIGYFKAVGVPQTWTELIALIKAKTGFEQILAVEIINKAKGVGLLKQKEPRGIYYLDGMDISDTPLFFTKDKDVADIIITGTDQNDNPVEESIPYAESEETNVN